MSAECTNAAAYNEPNAKQRWPEPHQGTTLPNQNESDLQQLLCIFSGKCHDYRHQGIYKCISGRSIQRDLELPLEIIHKEILLAYLECPRAVYLARVRLQRLPHDSVVMGGICYKMLPHLLPLIIEFWTKFNTRSHQMIISLLYFATDFTQYGKMSAEFTSSICNLVSKIQAPSCDEPPRSSLLEFALRTGDVVLLTSILTNQRHAKLWVSKNKEQARNIAGNNIRVHALINEVEINSQ